MLCEGTAVTEPRRFRVGTTFRGDDEALVTVTGPVDNRDAARVVTLLRALLQSGARRLVVDLAQVENCDPALTAYLDRERRRVRALGGWMIVAGSPATLRHDTSTLAEIFRVYQQVCLAASARSRSAAIAV